MVQENIIGNWIERKPSDSRQRGNFGAEKQTESKQEFIEYVNARLLEAEQNFKKHLDEIFEQFVQNKNIAENSEFQTQERARIINDQARQAMDNIAPSVDPWVINPRDIDGEHLAKIFNSGIISRALEKVFPGKIKQSRIKKADQEIKQARKINEEESRKQKELGDKITKLEEKRKKKETQVMFQESRLKIERDQTVEPAKREYERLEQEVKRLNAAQYKIYEHPIRKIGNFFEKQTVNNKLFRAKSELEKQQKRIRPMESNYEISMSDLNNLKQNIEHLNQNIKASQDRISGLKQELLRMAGIELPQPQNTTEKRKTTVENNQGA